MHAIKAKTGVETKLQLLLSPTINEGERSDSRSGRFTPGNRTSVTCLLEGQMVSQGSLEKFENREISTPAGDGTVGRPDHDLVLHVSR